MSDISIFSIVVTFGQAGVDALEVRPRIKATMIWIMNRINVSSCAIGIVMDGWTVATEARTLAQIIACIATISNVAGIARAAAVTNVASVAIVISIGNVVSVIGVFCLASVDSVVRAASVAIVLYIASINGGVGIISTVGCANIAGAANVAVTNGMVGGGRIARLVLHPEG